MARSTIAWTIALGAALHALAPGAASAQGRPHLVADLSQQPSEQRGVEHLAAVGDLLYFAASDGEHGFELWASDGTAAGTVLVADLRAGPASSRPRTLTAVGDRVFFVADDGVHGTEPWVSDGTPGGTHVLDVRPGVAGSFPTELTALDDELLFAADDGASGVELWASDGTPGGTRRVADVKPGPDSSSPHGLVASGAVVFFAADDGVHGTEPWASDGTEVGTALVEDLRPGGDPDGSQPFGFLPVDGAAYFGAFTDATGWALWRADVDGATLVADIDLQGADALARPLVALDGAVLFRVGRTPVGSEVWRTDGAPGGEELVSSFVPHFADSTPTHAVAMGGNAYFVGFDPAGGAVLMRSDGTAAGTFVIADLNVYPCSSEFGVPVVVGDRLFLRANEGRDRGELWTSDGTAEGTHLVKDIFPGDEGSLPHSLTAVGETLFFRASDGLHGRELWKSDGTEEGTEIVADIFPGNRGTFERVFTSLVALEGSVLFGGGLSPDPLSLPGLWRSDGSAAGTAPLAGTKGLSVDGSRILQTQTQTFFWADDGVRGAEPWRTDGTPAGTSLVAEVLPGPGSSTPRFAAATVGDRLFFAPDLPGLGEELWVSNGTAAGTRLVRDIVPGAVGSAPRDVVAAGERVFFSAQNINGRELWTTDGTSAGTRLVKDIRAGALASGLSEFDAYLTPAGDVVYFVADDASHGRELWRSDGSAEGTFMLRNIRPGHLDALPPNHRLLALGELVLFAADDGTSGLELWRSDGTEAGTVRVKDIWPGGPESSPALLGVAGPWAYFRASDGQHGHELWRTDGTAAGTAMVKDIAPGPDGSWPGSFAAAGTAVGPYFYFRATTVEHGDELWVTDGTEAGTYLVGDVNPDGSSSPERLTNAAGRLFFTADDGVHGAELWALSCGDGVLDDGEACDDGAQNGGATSCCTEICTLRPEDLDGDGTGDRCDPADAVLDLRHAQVRADGPSPRLDGTVVVKGHLAIEPAAGDAFDPTSGLAIAVRNGAGLDERATWAPGECTATRGGVLRCRAADATARFTRAIPDGAGRPRWFLHVRLARRAITGPLVGPLEATLTHGSQIDRVGTLARCTATVRAMRCLR